MKCSWLEPCQWRDGRALKRVTGTLVSRDVSTETVTIRPDPGQDLDHPGDDRVVDPYSVCLVTYLKEEGKIGP